MGSAYQIQDQQAPYFATFQVVGWADVFTRQGYREIVIDSLGYCQEQKGLEIYAYVIMSNHIHCILRSKQGKLSETIRDFKRHTSKEILLDIETSGSESRKEWLNMVFSYHAKYNKRAGEKQFWTHENHFVLLDSNDMLESRVNYIHQNPVKAGWVSEPEHYLYSSAGIYCGNEGLLEVTVI